jgi:hypothetical protein
VVTIDSARLPAVHVAPVAALVGTLDTFIADLSPLERSTYTLFWSLIARAAAPVVVRDAMEPGSDHGQQLIDKLSDQHLIWYDHDLRAVLQCPPFSALHSSHIVKAFGWDRAYVPSFLDTLLAIMLYGPNTWLKIDTTCPRSGERLGMRVMQQPGGTLRLDTPQDAATWRAWVPDPSVDQLGVGFHGSRAALNLFNSQADLETYLRYHADVEGAIYTLDQVAYLAQCLLTVYAPLIAMP